MLRASSPECCWGCSQRPCILWEGQKVTSDLWGCSKADGGKARHSCYTRAENCKSLLVYISKTRWFGVIYPKPGYNVRIIFRCRYYWVLSEVVKNNFFFYIFQEISGSQTWLGIRIKGWGRGGSFFNMTDSWTGISKGGAGQSIFWMSSPVGFGHAWAALREGVRVPLKPKVLVTPVQPLPRWLSSYVSFSILPRKIESFENQDGDDDDGNNCDSHITRRGLVLSVLSWL